MNVPIKFKKLHEHAKLPQQMTEGAACFDLTCTRITMVDDSRAILYFGLACEFPQGFVLTIQPRSSFGHKGWEMSNSPGQVDSDYRGELQAHIQAFPSGINKMGFVYPDCPYKPGDRVAQCRLEALVPVYFVEVESLSDTSRKGGYGSTGK